MCLGIIICFHFIDKMKIFIKKIKIIWFDCFTFLLYYDYYIKKFIMFFFYGFVLIIIKICHDQIDWQHTHIHTHLTLPLSYKVESLNTGHSDWSSDRFILYDPIIDDRWQKPKKNKNSHWLQMSKLTMTIIIIIINISHSRRCRCCSHHHHQLEIIKCWKKWK